MERSKVQSSGVISSVPCPWCHKLNDFRDLQEQQLLEQGAVVDCDHCKRHVKIVVIDTRPRIGLAQHHR